MRVNCLSWSLLFLLGLSSTVLAATIRVDDGLRINKLQRLFELVKKTNELLTFFESDFNDVNVDGLYGIRIAEGSLIVASEANYYGLVESDLKQLIDSIRTRLISLADKTYKSVVEQEPDYAGGFDVFLNSPSISNFTRDTHILDEYKHANSLDRAIEDTDLVTSFDEAKSDACYTSLLDDKQHQCKIADSCLEYYSDRRASAYFLTHQYLFLTVVDKSACNDKVLPDFLYHISENSKAISEIREIYKRNRYGREDLKYGLTEYFCSRIYEEAISDVQVYKLFGYLPGGIDLLIERLLLCSMNNVKDFKSDEWLDIIYSYQLSSGCFGYLTSEIAQTEPISKQSAISLLRHRQSKNLKKIEELLTVLKEKEQEKENRYTSSHVRAKRSEKQMDNGCLSHLSGLAIGYYSTMIKALLENM